MKRRFFGLLLLLALLLSACGSEPASAVHTVVRNDKTFTVDTAQGTITCGEDVYRYTVEAGPGTKITTRITYPNGNEYFWTEGGNISTGGWSEGYNVSKYVDGSTLIDVLEQASPTPQKRERSGNPLFGFICILIGALNLAFPQVGWYLKHGWYYKDAEPSDVALGLARFGGGAAIVIGIILMFI